jgi:cellular nucleic acid-binding protein
MFGRSFNIYVLELLNNKYYVGKTLKNVPNRFNEHATGIGSEWTKLYKPIKIIEQFETNDKFLEDKYTKIYMDKKGIDNVRGGSYTKINLEDWQIKCLELELKTANNLCYKCGKPGHFSNDCNHNKKIKFDMDFWKK